MVLIYRNIPHVIEVAASLIISNLENVVSQKSSDALYALFPILCEISKTSVSHLVIA